MAKSLSTLLKKRISSINILPKRRKNLLGKNTLIFSAGANEPLARQVANSFDMELSPVERLTFPNGEVYVRFPESVRRKEAIVIQSHQPPINDNLMQALIMIEALTRSGVRSVTVGASVLPYSKQDRQKNSLREPISSALVARLFEAAGMNNQMATVELHDERIKGFYTKPVVNEWTTDLFLADIKDRYTGNLVFCAPDLGAGPKVRYASKTTKIPFVLMEKIRDESKKVDEIILLGDVRGKDVIILDDMVDTGGTLIKAVNELYERGAKSVVVYAAHAWLSLKDGIDPVDLMKASPLKEVVFTDTIEHVWKKAEQSNGKIRVISSQPLLHAALIKTNGAVR